MDQQTASIEEVPQVSEDEEEHLPNYAPPEFPIVFCHGLFGFEKLGPFHYWRGVKARLSKLGCKVYFVTVPPTESIAQRAACLHSAILKIVATQEKKNSDNSSATSSNNHLQSKHNIETSNPISGKLKKKQKGENLLPNNIKSETMRVNSETIMKNEDRFERRRNSFASFKELFSLKKSDRPQVERKEYQSDASNTCAVCKEKTSLISRLVQNNNKLDTKTNGEDTSRKEYVETSKKSTYQQQSDISSPSKKYARLQKDETKSTETEEFNAFVKQVEEDQKKISDDGDHDGQKVHLVAHSMGGLDARYMISILGGYKHVFSLTTLSTPHRGSSLAPYLMKRFGDRMKMESLLKTLGIPTAAFHQLSPQFMEYFNSVVIDRPEVRYFSYGGGGDSISLLSPLKWFHSMLYKEEGPNDGMVSVESSKWGNFLGIIQENHLEQMNWRINPFVDTTLNFYEEVSSFLRYSENKKQEIEEMTSVEISSVLQQAETVHI